jgi:uncharacterized protein (DUF885 family)
MTRIEAMRRAAGAIGGMLTIRITRASGIAVALAIGLAGCAAPGRDGAVRAAAPSATAAQSVAPVALAAPAAAGTAAPATAPAAATASDSAEARRLHALFDSRWEAQMQRYPEWASYLGDMRYGDRLSDASPQATAAAYADAREALARARAIRRSALGPVDQVSLDMFMYELEEDLRFEPFAGFRSLSLGALGGFQSDFADLLSNAPVDTRAQAEQVLARIAAYPRRVEQELARLREGLRAGWVPPRSVLERVLVQLDAELAPTPEQGPFFEPFARLGKEISEADRKALRERARQAIAEGVLQPLRRLRAFVADEYLPAAPVDGAFGRYPQGAEVYAALVQSRTTTDLTAAQIHAIGQRETARLRGEMDAVRREVGFVGDFARFVEHLNTDPKFFHSSPEALLAGYRDIAKRIDPELPRLFALLPRATYGVRAMPAHMSPDRAEYYDMPALDGSRGGWFNANTAGFRTRPIWGMETLVAHEAVPGHHLQIARALELGDLPKFRRSGGNNAFIEGWALYAETLGFELGLYNDPHSRFGHLQWQAFRAARLVVDTGIHALGWSRQQAIDWMAERTGVERKFVTSEVDRYYSWPAQALGYMVGELKIIELRDRAKAALGARFDIRRFHTAVLDQGSVPLPVLERAVNAWIAAEAAPAPARR